MAPTIYFFAKKKYLVSKLRRETQSRCTRKTSIFIDAHKHIPLSKGHLGAKKKKKCDPNGKFLRKEPWEIKAHAKQSVGKTGIAESAV